MNRVPPTQLDLFTALPNAAIVSAWADSDAGPYPCDRCGRQSDTLAAPNRNTYLLWCSDCRSQVTLCVSCNEEIGRDEYQCEPCRAEAASENSFDDRYGDR